MDDDALAVPEVVPRGHEGGRRALAHFGPQPPRRRLLAVAAMACPHARRRGDGVVALHALGRYREALPELGKARDLEPKNAQVADAIRFAEMRLSRPGGVTNYYCVVTCTYV